MNKRTVFAIENVLSVLGASDFKDIKEFISKELILKVVKELKELNYSGVIRFSGFVEPLLDKKIYDHIQTFKKYLPLGRVEVVTNGDPLNLTAKKIIQLWFR